MNNKQNVEMTSNQISFNNLNGRAFNEQPDWINGLEIIYEKDSILMKFSIRDLMPNCFQAVAKENCITVMAGVCRHSNSGLTFQSLSTNVFLDNYVEPSFKAPTIDNGKITLHFKVKNC